MIHLAPVNVLLAADAGHRPATVIDVEDDVAAGYWARRLNVSRDQLFAAIGEVGSSVAAVRRYLGK